MAGIVSTVLAGAAVGVGEAGKQFGGFLANSALQAEAAEIQKMRDERLNEWMRERDTRLAGERRDDLTFADELRRAPAKRAAAKAERYVSDRMTEAAGSDSLQMGAEIKAPLSQQDEARQRARAYREEGLVEAAASEEGNALRRDEIASRALDQDLDRRLREKEVDANAKYRDAMLKIQGASEGRMKAGAELDNAIKQIMLDNATRVEALRKEFGTAASDRKTQITEEIQILTGKDNDNYLPVPLKDELGAVTGYKIFDKKRGKFADDGVPKTGPQWDTESGDVYLNGRLLGNAKNRTDAAALVAKARGAK